MFEQYSNHEFASLYVLMKLGALTLSLHLCKATNVQEKTLSKVTSADMGSDRLGPSWYDQSLASCVYSCQSRYSSKCQTIMYHKDTGLCTPGSFLKFGTFGSALVPTSTEGDLFAPITCDTSDGFSLVTSGTLKACIKISNDPMNYPNAYAFCLNLGAHLYVSRSIERFNMLPHGIKYLIGLTDIDSENSFVWQDSGYTISATFKTVLFRIGEPNNSGGNEDCVTVRPGDTANLANDFPCQYYPHKFVCERPMLV